MAPSVPGFLRTLSRSLLPDTLRLPLFSRFGIGEGAPFFLFLPKTINLKPKNMTKKETVKYIIQLIVAILTAIGTSIGVTSCYGL